MEAPPIPCPILRCCDSDGGQSACSNGGSRLRRVETLNNKGSALFLSGVEVTAGSGNDAVDAVSSGV